MKWPPLRLEETIENIGIVITDLKKVLINRWFKTIKFGRKGQFTRQLPYITARLGSKSSSEEVIHLGRSCLKLLLP